MAASSSAGAPEVLYENGRTRVSRVRTPGGGTVIRKEALGPGSAVRVRHEREMLRRLAGVRGVAQPVEGEPCEPTAIVFADPGGRPLAELTGPRRLEPARQPSLAQALARILVDVHRAGVMHRDIHPGNIIVTGEGPVLVDFDLATTFAEVRPAFTHHREITGRLPYLAPEQTGRTGLPVDLRADLYGLGATLYAVAAGTPPLGDGDRLRLVRDILARVPDRLRDLPPGYADIVERLLHKEPDRRYQSGEGLVHDLVRLCEHPDAPLRIGERDFPSRLVPPAALVGRDAEIEALRAALRNSRGTAARGLLVAGAPGVGKSVLIEQVRPMVTAGGGWYICGKYDQFRHDTASGAVVQAMTSLGRFLLAEPDADLAAHRDRITAALGSNVGLAARVVPEFGALLGSHHPVPVTEPGQAEARLRQTAVDLLRAVASADRPIVMVLDDLQWANQAAISIIDAILLDAEMRGLLVIGAYREADVDAAHPMTAMLSRWERLGVAPALLRLGNLPPADLAALLGGMLRLPAAPATELAEVIDERTGGNPFDTVELVNALRRDGALTLDEGGWRWDRTAVRQYIGHGDVVDLLQERIERLPGPTRDLLSTMSCLGGDVRLGLLATASGLDLEEVRTVLAAALEDALLVMDESDDPGVRFRHDRVQQAAREGLAPAARARRHLAIARRLVDEPALRPVAAEQYLAVDGTAADDLDDPAERRLAARLFTEAAVGATRASNHIVAERYLRAAIQHLRAIGDAVDVDLRTARHAALYNMGRLDEADEEYANILAASTDPMDLVDATCVQISSIANRVRPADAVALGLDLLGRLGVPGPGDDPRHEVERRIGEYAGWMSRATIGNDLSRPEMTDRRALAAARVMRRMGTPAYWTDLAVMLWLGIEAQRLWTRHGPCPELIGTVAAGATGAIALRGDYAIGSSIARHAVAVGEARGYELDTAQGRHFYAVLCAHWSEPIEESVRHARLAREGLIRGGDLQTACFSHYSSVFALTDCGTLDDLAAEVEAALTFGSRTGNEAAATIIRVYRQFGRAMRGETEPVGSLGDDTYDVRAQAEANPRAAVHLAIMGGLIAALYDDSDDLVARGEQVRDCANRVPAQYGSVQAAVIGALAAARELHRSPSDRHARLLSEFDATRAWLAQRAADVPMNVAHLLLLIDAERAWATGDLPTAAARFDAAARMVVGRPRPWHRALITERTGLFHLATGMRSSGRRWLAEARAHYRAWGATGKVREMDRVHPFLRRASSPAHGDAAEPAHSVSVRSDDIDMLAILRASQVLSSETDLDRLQTSVVDQLRAITGATGVELALPDEHTGELSLPANGPDRPDPIPVDGAAARGLLPLTALRYVERTRQPLLVEDAVTDDRFARDPYLAALERCSLLLVPVLHQGTTRAIVVMENRLSSGAFSADRLDAVNLLAGQLAVSLNNALLYRHLEAKVAERTAALEAANAQLEALSITDQLTGLANRRRFDEVLESSWRDALAGGTAIGIVLVDVDHFKRYNDHYGHQAGDTCLRTIATALAGSVRHASDLVCRYGGEEFALVLPGGCHADAERHARAVAERARAAVAALNEPHARADAGIVTLSAGVATIRPALGDGSQALIKAADDALYEAKSLGRNRIVVASSG